MQGPDLAPLRCLQPFRGGNSDRFPRSLTATIGSLLAAVLVLSLVQFRSQLTSVDPTIAIAVLALLIGVWPMLIVNAVLLPWRVLTFMLTLILSFAQGLSSSLLRNRAWRIVQESLFGLTGSPFVLSQLTLERMPRGNSDVEFVYEDLDPRIVADAVKRRAASVATAGDSVNDAIARLGSGSAVRIAAPSEPFSSAGNLAHCFHTGGVDSVSHFVQGDA